MGLTLTEAQYTEHQDRVKGRIICAACGINTKRTGPAQKYCGPCSEQRDLERKGIWAREHPAAPNPEKNKALRSEMMQRGAAISEASRTSMVEAVVVPVLQWFFRVSVPFDYAASKNHIYAMSANGHRFLRKEASAFRANLGMKIAEAAKGVEIKHNKVWIDIFAQKSNHKGDAANFVDLVCDAVKDAIPVDDRWYSLRSVDWEVVKGSRGMLYVGLGQEECVNSQVCSSCGLILPFGAFNKNRSSKRGIGRNCKECRKRP